MEYIYAGEDWSPKVGDVCEVRESNVWRECLIVALGNPYDLLQISPSIDYTIDIHGHPCPYGKGPLWLCLSKSLRKKRPPQQDDRLADEDFITDLKSLLNREGVEA